MSNFKCEKCGAVICDAEYGYVTGCAHYPPDDIALRYTRELYTVKTKAQCKAKEKDNDNE